MSVRNVTHANGGTRSGSNGSNGTSDVKAQEHSPVPPLWITGLGAQYPPYLSGPEKLDRFAKRLYGDENLG
jgi:hypothetical protein